MKDETHHTLLKDKCKKIIIIIIIMIIVYSVPFLLIFIQNFTNDSYFYSYAPTGLTYKIDNCTATLILYCGINFN
jgi:flagellar basal body-associated protein FliL